MTNLASSLLELKVGFASTKSRLYIRYIPDEEFGGDPLASLCPLGVEDSLSDPPSGLGLDIKGTVPRDCRLQVFFIESVSPKPL